jgi:hypothetical protein
MIEVELPDGSIAEFPDGTSREVMTAAIQKRFAPPKMDAAGFGEHLMTGEQSTNIERANPQASRLPGVVGQFDETSRAVQGGFNDLLTLGFGDEIYAGATAPFRAIPGALNGEGYDLGKAYNEGLDTTRQTMRDTAALNPVAHTTGQVAGAIVNPLGRGKAATTTGGRVLQGLNQGAVQGGIYGAGSSDGDLRDRAKGALTGGATGAAFGAAIPWLAKKGGDVVEGVLQNRATAQAVRNAPAAADLKSQARSMFQAVDNSGVTVDTGKFSGLVQKLVSTAKRDRINPTLDAKATEAYRELIGALDDVQKNGGSLTISDLHTLRQIAQKSAMSSEGRDAMFAGRIVEALDDFVTQSGAMKFPPNRLGNNAAGNELLKAISTWSRARKLSLVESAIEKAQSYPSGVESGLRSQFKTLLNGKSTAHLFTKAERQAMQGVVNGTLPVNALRSLGIFRGLGGAVLGSLLGGPLGTVVGGAAGLVGRKVTEKATEAAAERAARVVGSQNIPNVTIRNPLTSLPGQALAPPLIDEMNRRRAVSGPRI